MTYNSIQHLLNNRRYIGEYTYRDIVVPDGIPAIVPQDLFDRVQEKLAKNKKAPARHKAEDDYLLTTKPVSYTHLDVYKRQTDDIGLDFFSNTHCSLSFPCLPRKEQYSVSLFFVGFAGKEKKPAKP